MSGQRRILVLCWLAYALCYTLRVNIAVIIPAMVSTQQYTLTQMGLVTGLYFAVYMTGQLINGYLGDRFSSKILIVSGLVLSALCNLGMAAAGSFPILLICWGVNGLAQSMLWGPIMKTLAVWFAGYQLGRVSFYMSLSMIVGSAASWGLSSGIVRSLGWPAAFRLPALLVLVYALLLPFLFRNRPADSRLIDPNQAAAPQPAPADADAGARAAGPGGVEKPTIREFFQMIRLPGLLLISLTQGLIREGIGVWFPTILQQAGPFSGQSPWLVLLIIPVINFGGILLVRRLNRQLNGDSTRTLLLVFVLAAAVALLLNLLAGQGFWLVILVMVVLLALTYGMTPILTSVIPFQYAHYQHVALTAGAIDFAIYSGAALSGVLSGLIAERFAWSGVMVLWLAAAAAGLILSAYRYHSDKGRQTYEQTIHHPS